MSEDYLWDRTGPPDPDIERLERALAPLRYRHRSELLRTAPVRPAGWWGAAAARPVTELAGWQLTVQPDQHTAWRLAAPEGTAFTPVRAGQTLHTGSAERLTLEADELGRVDLGPNSEVHASPGDRLLLRRGLLHAFIWAPPPAIYRGDAFGPGRGSGL